VLADQPLAVSSAESGRALPRRPGKAQPDVNLSVRDREARADRHGGELIYGVAAGAPVGKLLVVEAIGHMRLPFATYRPNDGAWIKVATIDAHRAAEAAADIEGGFDDGVAGKARRGRLEIRDFPGGLRGPFRILLLGRLMAKRIWGGNDPAGMCIAWTTLNGDAAFRKRKTPAGDDRGFRGSTAGQGGMRSGSLVGGL